MGSGCHKKKVCTLRVHSCFQITIRNLFHEKMAKQLVSYFVLINIERYHQYLMNQFTYTDTIIRI